MFLQDICYKKNYYSLEDLDLDLDSLGVFNNVIVSI
jgi:hypothetical protein